MMTIRRAAERGHADHGWLKSAHTFSFANYYDPTWMGFGALRVINDDRIAPGRGFGKHPHRDMEIISYVLEGALAHEDSMGNRSTIVPGDVQRMSAGTGVFHSEMNPLPDAPGHFLQIWLLPETGGIAPSYEQIHFPPETKRGRFRLVASRDGREGSVSVHQDVAMSAALIDGEEAPTYTLAQGRKAWVQIARGSVSLNGQPLLAGDAAAVTAPGPLAFADGTDAEVIVFDLAA
jgi:hypothetical protein